MTLSYNKLWKLLIDKGMTKKNETVSMEVLLKICKVLECNVGDIMDVINEETTDGNE